MADTTGWRFRPFLLLGYTALALLVLGLGGWGVTARISGAVIASGQVEVLGNRQVVQHPTGGVVVEIIARDGDRVAAGEVLLRLEGDESRAQLAMVASQLFELNIEAHHLMHITSAILLASLAVYWVIDRRLGTAFPGSGLKTMWWAAQTVSRSSSRINICSCSPPS